MGGVRQQLMAAVLVAVALMATAAEGYITQKTWGAIRRANRAGPFVGLVVPNTYEMVPVLESPSFVASKSIPNMDIQGRRFRFGTIEGQSVVMVMTGLSMLNAGLTTQMLLSLFRVKGIVHWGIAGNANEDLQIGDVTIPEYWAHVSLWNWQRFGDGKDNELPLEAAGDYTREYGFLNFSDYTVGQSNPALSANQLNSIWYQPEEIFPKSGEPEERQHAFWVPASKRYYALAAKLEGMELPACVNATTCLPRAPRVTRVSKGCSANVFLDNAEYRQFLRKQFECTPVEMESAAVALVAHTQGVPFLTIRSLSDLAGGGSALGNEASTFIDIAAKNAVEVMLKFVPLLGKGGDEMEDGAAADM
ncbi:bark storage protein A [Triticum urartu]|uniref:Nucleoside phosphorylase domain-containing protein n=1 Tax=Triticum urartu TaxID=4572 RepID=A0A8R7PRC2_TRIUA|nr:bark storage protein A [Triticum urartu]